MNTRNLTLIIILAVILLFGGCACGRYNGMVTADQNVQNKWGDVETQYQRRTDLYNSVIKVIEGSANFEKSTLTAVIQARANATAVHVNVNDSASLNAYQRAQAQLSGSFSRLMAVAESYPDLKTTQQFADFQTNIAGTENRINVARRDYNAAVNDYNLKVRTFPNNIFAGMFNFHEKPYYQAAPGSENAPDIQFNIK
ncbi:MAG TPA: LemA family protein [Puia sp.]|jgi:LemA protein|nr:LemA family protein [Puia sp.]